MNDDLLAQGIITFPRLMFLFSWIFRRFRICEFRSIHVIIMYAVVNTILYLVWYIYNMGHTGCLLFNFSVKLKWIRFEIIYLKTWNQNPQIFSIFKPSSFGVVKSNQVFQWTPWDCFFEHFPKLGFNSCSFMLMGSTRWLHFYRRLWTFHTKSCLTTC